MDSKARNPSLWPELARILFLTLTMTALLVFVGWQIGTAIGTN